MSYAIIRNEKYTKDQMIKLAPHNERVKSSYSNKNIDKSKSYLNYHLKKPMFANYFKEFKRLKEENNLKGQLHKNSIYACEMIITSDKNFFSSIGEKESKRYFQIAYDFICKYKNLGEENIISAVVHLDEETPHMHLAFIPVVDSKDKDGNAIRKIGGYDFWKEKNSYMNLQNSFYEYVSNNGFNLDRGISNPNKSYKSVEDFKELTNFYETKKLSKENELLKATIQSKQSEIDIYTNLIVRLNNEKEELIEKVRKYGITLENYKELTQ